MIEVDVFWSFAIGASCACAASKQLSQLDSAFGNKYFAYTLFVLSCVFSPSGSYLLIAFPGWESMFILNREIINKYPLLITIFNCTNSLLGIIGFYCVHKMVRNNQKDGYVFANVYWIVPYLAMFAILGFGYDRFLFPSTFDEYYKDVHDHPEFVEFFKCDVFYTLLAMGVILVPMLYYPIFAWNQHTKQEMREIKCFVIQVIYLGMMFIYCIQFMITGIYLKRVIIAGVYGPTHVLYANEMEKPR